MTQPPDQPPWHGSSPQNPGPSGPPGPPSQPPAAPQPPPAPQGQPGYGYPAQGPYGAPPQPGPYAPTPQPGPYTPPSQPGPYAPPGPYNAQAPQGPYGQQPPYGYPPQQPPQGPGPGGGRRGPFKGRTGIVVAAAVAAVLVAGGIVFAVVGGGDDKKDPVAKDSASPSPSVSRPVDPGDGQGDGKEESQDLNEGRKPGEAKVLWYKDAPDAPGNGADAPALWIYEGIAVKPAYQQVFAYDVATGEPAWGGKPVKVPQTICAAPREIGTGGKVVLAYRKNSARDALCDQLMELDLKTGKSAWHKQVPEEASFDILSSVQLSISGDTVTVARMGNASAFKVSTGEKLFTTLGKDDDDDCGPDGFAGGERLLVAVSCGSGQDTERVRRVDPVSGKQLWSHSFPEGWKVTALYSVNPAVVYLTNEDEKKWNVTVLDDSGKVRSELSTKDSFAPQCESSIFTRDLGGCLGAVADDKNLYLPTESDAGKPNEVVAFALDTGKESWRTRAPGEHSMLPVKTENGTVVLYAQPSYETGGLILSVPQTGGAAKTLLTMPQGTSKIEDGYYNALVNWVDGRFFLAQSRLSGDDDAPEKLMMAFGK